MCVLEIRLTFNSAVVIRLSQSINNLDDEI